MYCAVTGSSNTVIPPETVSEPLVKVTVVEGPPVEVQVRALSTEVRVHSECHITWYGDITCSTVGTESIDILKLLSMCTLTYIQSCIHSLPTIIIIDCIGLNSAAI